MASSALSLSLVSGIVLAAIAAVACGEPSPDAAKSSSSEVIDAPKKNPDADASVELATIACGAAMPGPALATGDSGDGDPTFSLDVDVSAVPDPVDLTIQSKTAAAIANYVLGRNSGTSFTHAEALARGELGKSLLVAAAKGTNGKLDIMTLRRGLYRSYLCATEIPTTLDALKTRFGDYKTWESFDIPCSKAKDGPRRIFSDSDKGVYVAETIVDGEVRETEVIFQKFRTDGQLDFAVYTHDGLATNRSTFAGGGGHSSVLPSPYTCMTCHVQRTTGTYSMLFPMGVGAGCEAPAPPIDPNIPPFNP